MDALKGISSFSPTTGFKPTRKTALAPTAFSEKIPFYHLPDNTTEEGRLVFSRYLAYCGTDKSSSIPSWKTWVATWTCLITPVFATRLPAQNYRKIDVTAQHMTRLQSVMSNLQTALDSEQRTEVDAAALEVKRLIEFPLLPRIDQGVDLGLGNGEWVGKVALCYYALVIHLAGKRIEGTDHSQITDARPKALKGKAHITDTLDFLEGELRMSDHSHLAVNNAWAEMGQLRSVVFMEYSNYDSDETDLAKDIIWTTMHLLRYSSMAHALITYNFLQAYPWAVEVPALRTSISIYISSLQKSAEVDQRLFPFIKLIYGDKTGMFPRKDMEPLIACAAAVQEETSASLADFYRNAAFNPVVDAFMAEKERREAIRYMGLQKKEKELMDYFGGVDEEEHTAAPADGAMEE